MFKKLRERIFNKKTNERLKCVEFDSFAYCGYSEYPIFIEKGTEYSNPLYFSPETDKTFELAFSKLKDRFFKDCDLEEIKIRLKVFKSHFNISEEICEECIKIAQEKICSIKEQKNQNNI